MYKLQELGDDRFKIQELQENECWFIYNFAYIKGLEELISYVKHWLEHYPNNKYRIIDRYINKVVYE